MCSFHTSQYTPCKIFMAGSPKKFTPIEKGKSSEASTSILGASSRSFSGENSWRSWICLKSLWVTSFGSNPTALPWLLPISLADLPFLQYLGIQTINFSMRFPVEAISSSRSEMLWPFSEIVFLSQCLYKHAECHETPPVESVWIFYMKKRESHPLTSARNLKLVVTSLSCPFN